MCEAYWLWAIRMQKIFCQLVIEVEIWRMKLVENLKKWSFRHFSLVEVSTLTSRAAGQRNNLHQLEEFFSTTKIFCSEWRKKWRLWRKNDFYEKKMTVMTSFSKKWNFPKNCVLASRKHEKLLQSLWRSVFWFSNQFYNSMEMIFFSEPHLFSKTEFLLNIDFSRCSGD